MAGSARRSAVGAGLSRGGRNTFLSCEAKAATGGKVPRLRPGRVHQPIFTGKTSVLRSPGDRSVVLGSCSWALAHEACALLQLSWSRPVPTGGSLVLPGEIQVQVKHTCASSAGIKSLK